MPGNEVIGKEEIKEVMDVMETGVFMRYGFDQRRKGVFKVRQFEEEFARYCGTGYALAVTSGSTALHVALNALDVGPGDEVVVPSFTFVATYEAILEAGAIPIMADIDESMGLDPKNMEKMITPLTKAVIPVHMCGAPAQIDKIVEVAKKNNLLVLEDTAQSCGGSYRGKKLGTFGDMGTFSFDYVKTMTTGEGGMVITNNKNLADRAEWYHDHGHDHNPNVGRGDEGRSILGFNYRMNELQGALGLAQLKKLDYIIGEQRRNKKAIKEVLAKIAGVGFRPIPDPAGDTATFLGFSFPNAMTAKSFQKVLKEEGTDTFLYKENTWHYVPRWEHFLAQSTANSKKYPFTNPMYKGKTDYRTKQIPRSEDILGRTLFMIIPVKMTKEAFERIAGGIRKAAEVL